MRHRGAAARYRAHPRRAEHLRRRHAAHHAEAEDEHALGRTQPPSAWVSDFAHKTIAVGEEQERWYFLRTDDPGFTRVLRAVDRYERATGTKLGDEPYEVIARITGEPKLVVVAAGKVQCGHQLEMLGALVGDLVFIDATKRVGDDSLFAGERD